MCGDFCLDPVWLVDPRTCLRHFMFGCFCKDLVFLFLILGPVKDEFYSRGFLTGSCLIVWSKDVSKTFLFAWNAVMSRPSLWELQALAWETKNWNCGCQSLSRRKSYCHCQLFLILLPVLVHLGLCPTLCRSVASKSMQGGLKQLQASPSQPS